MAIISTISHLLLLPHSTNSDKLSYNHKSTLISPQIPFFQNPRLPKFLALASRGGTNGNREIKDEVKSGDLKEDLKRDRRPAFNLRWRDLLNPDPENILAVGLTGLLTLASIQILWQILFISFAIVLAALKYSFIAAVLLFILITLL